MPTIEDSVPHIKSSVVTEVPAGATAVLKCNSNDYDHNFMFWLFDKNKVIGPGNVYDERKYKYEVLSGKLHIDVCKFFIKLLPLYNNHLPIFTVDFLDRVYHLKKLATINVYQKNWMALVSQWEKWR